MVSVDIDLKKLSLGSSNRNVSCYRRVWQSRPDNMSHIIDDIETGFIKLYIMFNNVAFVVTCRWTGGLFILFSILYLVNYFQSVERQDSRLF